jgi:N-hydroxyarylamine O-acetyltransferase
LRNWRFCRDVDVNVFLMNMFEFPLADYLQKIRLPRVPKADEEGLKAIHSAQAFSIPFENLDIHLGRGISLYPADLVRKLVHSPRGGYCFELNGLLCLALRAIGFTARPLLARVLYGRTDPGARTHQVVIVTLPGCDWLSDVGFGGPGLRLPMPLLMDRIHEQFGERYRLRYDSLCGTVLQKEHQGSFIDLYAFDRNELTLDIDIEMGNHFTSTWPQSVFRLRRMCSLPHPNGRVTLTDMQLSTHRNGEATTINIPGGPKYIEALSEHFGIMLDALYEDFTPRA